MLNDPIRLKIVLFKDDSFIFENKVNLCIPPVKLISERRKNLSQISRMLDSLLFHLTSQCSNIFIDSGYPRLPLTFIRTLDFI